MEKSKFLAWVFRMPLIKRWGLMHTVKPENVAEHSHQVAVIAHLLTVIKNKRYGGDLNPERAATLALYHEISETKLQDVNSRTKYHNPEFTQQFKRLEAIAEQECLATIPEDLRSEFAGLLIQNNVDALYRPIIKAADVIAAYIKALDELSFGNKEFSHVKINIEEKLNKIARDLPEVHDFISVFAEDCLATVDQLSGAEQASA